MPILGRHQLPAQESLVAIRLETKRQEPKADDSHASNVEVKNRESCTSTLIFHGERQWSVDYIQLNFFIIPQHKFI